MLAVYTYSAYHTGTVLTVQVGCLPCTGTVLTVYRHGAYRRHVVAHILPEAPRMMSSIPYTSYPTQQPTLSKFAINSCKLSPIRKKKKKVRSGLRTGS